ncbi:MAG: hypothetical protein CVV42_12320 [Candidatus Riflebacteria bacterium HGW-Riflebacteria-2]|jgi:hypothetical protein|nr:MAG: hypothetical protein CVV42_12320 [Candidatus Riflebacteria bacterium HGW-Riflebacteria-2]
MNKTLRKTGITFVEVCLAFLILGLVVLPVFQFLTGSVKDTERFYTETIAISRAKFIMDSLMFQMPWQAIGAGNPCTFEDRKNVTGIKAFIKKAVPQMFGTGCETPDVDIFQGDGLYQCRKGFMFRARVKVVDLDQDSSGAPIQFTMDLPGKTRQYFQIKDLVPKDSYGKYNLMKKIVVQVKWSNTKNVDPKDDPRANSIFLVAFKSDLEG